MEDAVSVHPSFLQQHERNTNSSHYFGVYDGHGCSHVNISDLVFLVCFDQFTCLSYLDLISMYIGLNLNLSESYFLIGGDEVQRSNA